GVRLFSSCRQQRGCAQDVSDNLMGTKGTCHIDAGRRRVTITGQNPWKYEPKGKDESMYQIEHNELIASIRSGKPIYNGDYMTKSTLMAIMGRMAPYTGQVITWDMALNSKEDLTPPKYEMTSLPVPPVARPGVTKFA